ncbi:MAG TPA: hypothetical protein VK550_16200 [Polyangiaceae bacterium]|nr:hypothetical protein [Polyangiaceae bacterium]
MSSRELFPPGTLLLFGLGLSALFVRWVLFELSRPQPRRGGDPWQRTLQDFELRKGRGNFLASVVAFVFLAIGFLFIYEDGKFLDGLFGETGPNLEGVFQPRPKQ